MLLGGWGWGADWEDMVCDNWMCPQPARGTARPPPWSGEPTGSIGHCTAKIDLHIEPSGARIPTFKTQDVT